MRRLDDDLDDISLYCESFIQRIKNVFIKDIQ